MALAVLQLEELGREGARFTVDTGTNRLYRLRVGRSTRRFNGTDWVDDITYESPLAENPNGGSLFGSGTEVVLPGSRLRDGARYVQLFSCKDRAGRATTYSDVVQVSSGATSIPGLPPAPLAGRTMNRAAALEMSRRIPCEMAGERYAQPASLDDVLGSVIKLAAPLVEQLLGGGTASAPGSAATPSGGPDALGKVLAVLLKTILGGGAGPSGANGANGAPSVAKSLSGASSSLMGNRFRDGDFARPFIFGIDDALIGMLAGPILQALPQLLNSANQAKVQMHQADNKLMSDAISDIGRRLLLQQIANAQPPPGASADLQKLQQLLQQSAAAPAGGAPAATSSSLSLTESGGDALSSRAVVGFQLADPLPWSGSTRLLFAQGSPLRLSIQLVVGEPVPKSALPKAIVRIAFRSPAEKTILAEKVFKLKGVAANTLLPLEFQASELARLPANEPIELFAEFRWRTAAGDRTCKALGSREVWFIGKYAVRDQGSVTGPEVELTDMSRYRAFWNKLWESPLLDATSPASEAGKKYLWELDVMAKYSILLSADHTSNGLMETRFLKSADDPDSLTVHAAGRMKGGIEVAISELNKLLPLWPGQNLLPPEQLAAFTTDVFAKMNAGEVVTRLKLDGKSGERGMVWAIPVFRLLQCTLATASKVDDNGQVVAVSEQPATFPVPVSVRMIGLKSRQ